MGAGGPSQALHHICEVVTRGVQALATGHHALWHPQVWGLVGTPRVHWVRGTGRGRSWVTSQAVGLAGVCKVIVLFVFRVKDMYE